ncbi:hypothetical protein [Paenibacillus sp. J2TS4]|nr:hypothetical protein [Paenibacillus sp. J2TS4]
MNDGEGSGTVWNIADKGRKDELPPTYPFFSIEHHRLGGPAAVALICKAG